MTAISNELVSVMLFALKNELSRMEAREVDQAAAQSKIVNKVNSKNQHCADHPFVVELKDSTRMSVREQFPTARRFTLPRINLRPSNTGNTGSSASRN